MDYLAIVAMMLMALHCLHDEIWEIGDHEACWAAPLMLLSKEWVEAVSRLEMHSYAVHQHGHCDEAITHRQNRSRSLVFGLGHSEEEQEAVELWRLH